jgi:hypothetical protein
MNNDEPRDDEPRDDSDWLSDAFDRAVRGDNGTAPEANRPATNPLGGPSTGETPPTEEPIQRNELDLDFETEASVPAGAFTPVVDFGDVNDLPTGDAVDPNEPAPDPLAVFTSLDQQVNHVEALPTESMDVLETPASETEAVDSTATAGIDGLDALFSDDKFSEGTTRIIEPQAPTVVVATVPAEAQGVDAKPEKKRFTVSPKALRIVGFSVGGLLLAVSGFVVGRVLSVPAPVPTPVETTAAPVTEMQQPGDYAWSELFGGECIDPFPGAWAEEFTVVSCDDPHAAQLVAVGDLSELEGSTYPGDDLISPLVSAECQKQGVLDLAVASVYPNMEVSFSHAANEDDWDAGNTSFSCFVNLADGSDITGSVKAEPITE